MLLIANKTGRTISISDYKIGGYGKLTLLDSQVTPVIKRELKMLINMSRVDTFMLDEPVEAIASEESNEVIEEKPKQTRKRTTKKSE